MYFKTWYLLGLSSCFLCLILLITLQTIYLDTSNSVSVITSSEISYYSYLSDSSSSSAENSSRLPFIMGDERRKSSSASSTEKTSSSEHFDIVQLNTHLKACIRKEDNEVSLDEYIYVFQQLYKFFIMLGTVFGFVGSDVKTKIEILQGYRTGENKSHYETIEMMLEYEKSTDYITSNKESSGSRTLLRLHRALNFVSKFLGKVDTIKDSEGTSHVCKEAYSETLSKYHPWLIQKGAILAMYALPTKKDLISRVCDGKIEPERVRILMHDVIAQTEKIFEQCETAYREKEMLDLP